MNKIKRQHILVLFISLAISGCVYKIANYDYTNLHQYTPELEADFHTKETLTPPYAALFETHDSQILYIAADHTIDQKSETFSLINKAFREYHPDFVIIEGLEENRGESPKKIIDYIDHSCLPGSTCSEGLWAAHLATKNKLKFIGGEASDQEIYKALTALNYTKTDFVFFYFVQQLPHYFRQGKFKSENDLSKLLALWLQEWNATKLTYLDFKNWYEKEMNLKVSYKDLIDSNTTAPIKNGTSLHQLSSKISVIRDKHIISVILKSLTTHKKILIVYGHSHFPTQKDVLAQYLGQPKFIRSNAEIKLKGSL